MKIIAGFEPTSGDTGEVSYKIIEEVVATTSPEELVACLEKWMPIKFETLVHLLDWKEVFNKLDERLTNIMHARRHELVLTDKEAVVSEGTPTRDVETDVRELKTILKFTAQVLENSIFKDVYNSAEILVELLNAYDDELMALALQALVSLAVAPQSHRCNLDMPESYSTALHQNQAYFDAIFELIDASYFVTDIPIQDFLSEDFEVTSEMRRVKVDLNTRSKYSKSLLAPDTRGEVVEVERFLLPENNFEIEDISTECASLKEILTVQATNLTSGLKLSLLCAVRMRRLLLTAAGRQQLMRIQYQATSVLVGCYPEISVLYTFFQDKIELIKNFIHLLRTGPGSLDYEHNLLDLDIRVIACQSLEAIVGSHDHATYAAPIVVRYPWMLYDMGLNKGQYMGTLPCLIRSAMSYLLSLEAAGAVTDGSTGTSGSSMEVESTALVTSAFDDMEDRLLWVENIFILLSAVVNEVESAVSALNDNGLVGSILQMVGREHYTVRNKHFKYVECLVVEILEMTVTHYSPALVSFKEKNGLESVINRLYREITMCLGEISTSETTSTAVDKTALYQDHTSHLSIIPVECSILIQRLFTLIRSVQSIGGTDANNTQWYKLPALTNSLKLIFAHASKVGHLILAPALSLLADIVGNDPAPPSILSYMITSGLAKEALTAVAGRSVWMDTYFAKASTSSTTTTTTTNPTPTPAIKSATVVFSEELMKALLDLISALSLTADGIALVNEVRPFKTLFSVFYNPEYVYPRSRVIMNSLPNLVGAGIEELLRHYPAYASFVINELVFCLEHITSMADVYVGKENFESQTGNVRFDAQYQNIVQFCTAFTLCLEPILLKKETVTALHERYGISALIKVLKIALGPPRYVLDSFACMVDSTAGSIGYTPLIAMVVHRCFHQIAEVEAVKLCEKLVVELVFASAELEQHLQSHAARYVPLTDSAVPTTIGGNANPLLAGLLDTVTRAPLQDYCDDDRLDEKLLSFARIVRGFAFLDVLVESLGLVLANRTDERILSQCLAVLSNTPMWDMIQKLIIKYSVPTHLEMARARGLYVNSTKENCVKVHPIYHLTVIAAEYINVKEGLESNVTVCRLGRGTTIEAYERQTSGIGSVLKYRTKLGWVSVYKTFASNDPQLLVTAITQKSANEIAEETARNVAIYEDPEKRSDFEKFANVSAKRGGFLALYHFNHTVKTHLLSVIGRHTFTKTAGAGLVHENYMLTVDSAPRVNVLMNCLKSLIPEVMNATPRSTFNTALLLDSTPSTATTIATSTAGNKNEAVEQSEPKSTRHKPLRARKDGPEPPEPRNTRKSAAVSETVRVDNNSLMFTATTNTVLKEQFFQHDSVPNMATFPTSVVYLSLRLIELSQALFFDIRRNKMELNPLFLAHTVYDNNTLESILHVALKVFLCALPDTEIETIDNPEHHGMYLGEWYPLKESELDFDRPEDFAAGSKSDTTSTSSAALEEKESAMDVESPVPATTAESTKANGKGNKGKKGKKTSPVSEESTSEAAASSGDASTASFKPFASYLAYRRALRERRLFAVSSIDNIIEWWKRLCSSLLPTVSSLERGLQKQVDKDHDLDIYGMKRYTVNLVSKYLSQVWSHPQLHLLPPTTTKNVLDLMAVVVKTMHDLKSVQSLRTPAPSAGSAAGSSAALGALDASTRRALGSARRINLGHQGANAALHAHLRALSNMNGGSAGAAPDFAVSEDTIRNVEEMGFTRRAITRAATLLHTNDVNSLVAYLLENPFIDEPDPPAPAAAAAPAPTAEVPAAATTETPAAAADASSSTASATAGSSTAAASAPAATAAGAASASSSSTNAAATAASAAVADDLLATMFGIAPSDYNLFASAFPSVMRSRSNSTFQAEAAEPGKFAAALPLVATQSEADLKAEKDLLQRILKCIYGDVPSLCMRLIEKGPSKHLALIDAETRARNAGVTTELNTVMVLNQMVRCLEKNPLPESLLKIVQLSWLYRRAITILKEGELNEEKFSGLFGLLHAIVVLLTCKVQSPSMGRAPAATNELHFLIFTLDDRYNELYPLLVATLESFTSELSGSTDGLSAAEASRVDWIGPAVLILDLISQPVLVEPESLRTYRAELESYGKPAGAENSSISADDSLLSEQVKSALDRLFLRKNSASSASLDDLFNFGPRTYSQKNRGAHSPMDIILPRSSGSASKLSDKAATSSGSAIKDSNKNVADSSSTPAEALPLFDDAVSVELKLRALKVGLSLLRLTANGKSANVNVPQAAMQLVAHLTRHPAARKEFHAQQGGVLVLRHRSSFAGMNSVVFTLLQQVLEDEKFLTQSMVTAIRLCLLRLSKQSSPHVLFKNFMEVISPVVFREQALFMKVLKSHTHIKCMSGQNFISLRETPLVEDKTPVAAAAGSETALVPADSATAGAAAAPVSAPAEVSVASASKKQRLADGSAATTAVHSAVKPSTTTPGASQQSAHASGIKSGAKRVLQDSTAHVPPPSASKAVPHGTSNAVTSHNESVNEIVDELFTRIICKYLSIKTMDAEGNTKLTTDFVAADTSLTIAQMLIIAADLIASLPSFAISVHRYVFNLSKVPTWAAQVATAELPVKHALTGQTLGGLFVTFVVHALLLPARVSYPAAADMTTDATPAADVKTKKAARIAAVEKLAGAPAALRDACSYFLASLASRPGEGRRRVLNEVLNTANIGSLVINTTEQFRALVAFSETILYLLNPPRKWASRDAFILPAKDILASLAKQNAHTRFSAAICALDLSHPLALETSIVLAVPLDIIIRKGLEPAPLAAALLAGADASAVKPVASAVSLNVTAPRTATAGARLSRLPSSDRPVAGASTDSSASAAAGTATGATTTPGVRRATFAASVTDSGAAGHASTAAGASQASNASSNAIGTNGVPLTAQSFVTPASNRRRGNTDQSLDAEERMLLLTSSEMHNASDQHDHLVRPAGAYDSDVDGSDDDFDEDEGAVDGQEVAQALGAGDAFHHMHDEDEDDDDEDDENEDGDDSDPDGSDDEEEGHGHGHGHHHIRHHAHHHNHGGNSSDEDSEGGDSGSDVTGERDDDDEDEDDDGDDDDDDDHHHHHDLDESGEFVEDEDDDDEDMDEMDSMGEDEDGEDEGSEVSEEPDLEVAIELDSASGSDGEGEEGEDAEGSEGEGEGSEGEGSQGSDENSEDMGMEDESEIEDDEVELDDDADLEHMMDVNAVVRRPRGRGNWRHAAHSSHQSSSALSQEEGEEGEDQGEGDDDEDSNDDDADQEDEQDGEGQEPDEIEGDFEGDEHEGSYFAGEDGYISNGDAREEHDEEGDLENQNNDDFWLEMNGAEEGGSASSAAPSARRMSHGGMSANAARSHVREFFTRARHNERSRARSSLGGGGAGNHTVTDITHMLREAAAAGGANVVSMGPLFAGGGGVGANGGEALGNRPFWMRGGEGGAGNMEDRLGQISNSFTDFLGNLLPPNMTLSSSTARVDPRTGAVTLSFGGTQNETGEAPAGRPVSAMSALAAQTSGHQAAARPPTHPLLAVTDASRNRFLQPCPNSLTLGGNARALVRAFPGLANQTSSGSTIDSSMRAGPVSERRNSVGPIVSDRRWGTDLGDLEPAGARLAALTTAVESALGDVIEREKPVETKSRSNSASGGSARLRPFGGLTARSRSTDHGGDGGDSYESDDNGDEDQDDSSTGGFADAFRAAAVARIRRQMGLGREPAESKEEEGELQESKETEPTSSGSSTIATSSQAAPALTEVSQSSSSTRNATDNSATITTADLAAVMPASVTAPVDTAMEVESTSSVAAPAPSTVGASTAAASAPVEVSIEEPTEVNAENLAFVESLSEDVRDEVLMSVDEDFIRSLPAHIQLEARALRESQMEVASVVSAPASTSSAGQSASSAAQPAAAPVAVPSFSIDFSSIMDDLRTINQSNADPAAPAVTSAASAASAAVAAPAEAAPMDASAEATLRMLMSGSSGSTNNATTSNNAGRSATNAAATSSTAVVAPATTPAPAAPTAEELRAAELQLTVSLAEDRADSALPFGAHLIARLLRSLFTTNKSKLPRSVLKLLSTACRYKQSRVWIIRALFGSLSHSGARVVDCVRKVPLESDFVATTAGVAAFEAEMTRLQTAVDLTSTSALNFRRILCGISFLFRKTDKLVWFDIMLRPLLEDDSVWLFGSLISLLSNPVNASSINLEYLLQVMEELVGAYSKMSAKQANELAAAAQTRIEANRRSAGGAPTRVSVSYAHTPAASLDTIFEGVDENSSGHKRRRLEDAETPTSESSSSTAMNMSPPSRGRAASIDIESAAADVAQSAAASASNTATSTSTALVTTTSSKDEAVKPVLPDTRHRMPFPVLVESEAKILCALAGSSECGGPARKRLMRVMRNLSLCDTNWMLFLDNLAVVGADLAARATREFSNLHNTLVEVVQNNESAATAMARPELSAPKSLSEVRLLNVLRIMSALRTRTGAAAPAEAEVVASRMRRIQANGLWESLCDCLDIVRDLEGITDVAADEIEDKNHQSKSSSSSSNGAKKPEEDKKVTLSSLTMRFMPLIECYLSVCATTMLVRPDNVSGSALNESQKELERMSSGFKRRHSRDDSHLPVVSAGASSNSASSMRQSPSIASTPMHGGPHADLASPFNLNRVNSMLPGSRFRQHPAYFQMQMELNDEAAAERLVNFTSQNRVLFNNVLRNNVQLLESSFSPLVSVPKCRQLLHFDIKRAFFKMKLKRMRQSAARMHGALRLNVRRSRVFEESFQALRYKTADEMRRRLSVNFHGEEGMDAGGLTREWYGVLAREIFNPNYALFTSTGDNVTFQPNSQSHINPDHNSYFKFVGRVIGKAICDGHLLDAHFTRSFYKHILGMPVSVVDLEAIDPEYFKSLKQILATPLDLLGLDLTFSAEQNDFGKIKIIDLIPQGQDVAVTDDTKHEYVKLLAHHRMTTAIRTQIDSFLEGFHELVPPELISIFDAQELELLISGLPDIDLDDLRAHTEYHSYKSTDPEIGYFWNVLKSFSKQEKALFLQFVTGTSKVPLDGFAALQGSDGIKQFNIHKAFGGSHLLPSAHTCFNQLDLPEYSTEEMLREKLLIAIREGSEGFGFA